jgi:hypothetical protein
MKRLTAADVEREIAALDGLDIKALHQHWRELYRIDPPYKIRSGFLRRAIAYRLQEIVYGGVPPRTLRRLAEELRAKQAPSRSPATASSGTIAPIGH